MAIERNTTNGDQNRQDGGRKGWIVAITCFFANGIIFGIINSFGILFTEIRKLHLDKAEISSRVSLIGSLAFGSIFLFIPLSRCLIHILGLRISTFLGALSACSGMIITVFLLHKLELLYICSLLFGFGSSIVFFSTIVILPSYFHKELGMISAIVSCGSCTFTIILPHILRSFIDGPGLEGAYAFLAGLTALLFLPSLIFPSYTDVIQRKNLLSLMNESFRIRLLKKGIYIVWTLGLCIAAIGYFTPMIYLPLYIEKLDVEIHEDYDGAILIALIAMASGVGRVLFTILSSLKFLTPFRLLVTSFIIIGLCLIIIPFTHIFYKFQLYVIINLCFGIGFFDGCLVSLLGPTTDYFSWKTEKTQFTGVLSVFLSLPITIGPPLAGYLYDHEINYKWTFKLAGPPMIIGVAFLCIATIIRQKRGT